MTARAWLSVGVQYRSATIGASVMNASSSRDSPQTGETMAEEIGGPCVVDVGTDDHFGIASSTTRGAFLATVRVRVYVLGWSVGVGSGVLSDSAPVLSPGLDGTANDVPTSSITAETSDPPTVSFLQEPGIDPATRTKALCPTAIVPGVIDTASADVACRRGNKTQRGGMGRGVRGGQQQWFHPSSIRYIENEDHLPAPDLNPIYIQLDRNNVVAGGVAPCSPYSVCRSNQNNRLAISPGCVPQNASTRWAILRAEAIKQRKYLAQCGHRTYASSRHTTSPRFGNVDVLKRRGVQLRRYTYHPHMYVWSPDKNTLVARTDRPPSRYATYYVAL